MQNAYRNNVQSTGPAALGCRKSAGAGWRGFSGRWRPAVCLLAFLLLFSCAPAALADLMATWSCTPGAGREVHTGDTIEYALVVQALDEEGAMEVLRVQLGKGMQLDRNSVSIVGEDEEKTVESKDLALDNDGLGFVFMTSELKKGDSIRFNALVAEADAQVVATAAVGDFRAEVMHQLIAPLLEGTDSSAPGEMAGPVRPDAFAQEEQPGQGNANGMQVFLLAVCAVALVLACWKFISMMKEFRARRR